MSVSESDQPAVPGSAPAAGERPARSVLPTLPSSSGRSNLFVWIGVVGAVCGVAARTAGGFGIHLPGVVTGILGGIFVLSLFVVVSTQALGRGEHGTVRDGLTDIRVAMGRMALIAGGLIVVGGVLLIAFLG